MSGQPTDDSQSHASLTWTFVASDTSDEQYTRHLKIFLLHIPTGFVGVTMTFLVRPSLSATKRVLVDDEGNTISITVAAEDSVAITDNVKALAIASSGLLTLVSSATETNVVEGEATR